MDQIKKYEKPDLQVHYKGRLVSRSHFRVYVYNKEEEKKLAENYDEYSKLISSGLWFDEKPKDIMLDNTISLTNRRPGRPRRT